MLHWLGIFVIYKCCRLSTNNTFVMSHFSNFIQTGPLMVVRISGNCTCWFVSYLYPCSFCMLYAPAFQFVPVKNSLAVIPFIKAQYKNHPSWMNTFYSRCMWMFFRCPLLFYGIIMVLWMYNPVLVNHICCWLLTGWEFYRRVDGKVQCVFEIIYATEGNICCPKTLLHNE